MDNQSFFYYNPESQTQHGQFLPHPNNNQQSSTPALSGMDSSMPFPSTLMSSKGQSQAPHVVKSTPTLHVPTPILPSNSFSIEQFRKSNGMPTPSSPSLLAMDSSDLFFLPPTPTLSVASSASSPPMSCGMLTPQNEIQPHPWSLDDKPLDLQLHTPSGEWSPPLTPSYLCPPTFMRSQSSPSILLSAANCPSLSPESENSSSDLDFCDPRNLTYPTPSPAPPQLGRSFSADDIPTIKCEDSRDFLGVFSLSDTEDDFQFDLSQSVSDSFGTTVTTSLAQLQHSTDCDEELGDVSDCESVFGTDYLAIPSPPQSNCSREPSVAPKPAPRGRTPKKMKLEFDSDVELDEIILQTTDSAVPEPPMQNTFLTVTFPATPSANTHTSLTPAPTEGPTSCENSDQEVPKVPVVRRGRKQSLTDDPSKTFVCHIPQCGRRFRRQEHLKRHYRSLHTREKPFSCPECGKKFSRSDNLSQHTRIHGSGAIVMDIVDNVDLLDGDNMVRSVDGEELGRILLNSAEVANTLKEKLAGEKKRRGNKRKRDAGEA